jgi:hypothetical protein
MNFLDHATIAGILGAVVTVVKVVERTVDHLMNRRKKPQEFVLTLDPEASRMVHETHQIVTQRDGDGVPVVYARGEIRALATQLRNGKI